MVSAAALREMNWIPGAAWPTFGSKDSGRLRYVSTAAARSGVGEGFETGLYVASGVTIRATLAAADVSLVERFARESFVSSLSRTGIAKRVRPTSVASPTY